MKKNVHQLLLFGAVFLGVVVYLVLSMKNNVEYVKAYCDSVKVGEDLNAVHKQMQEADFDRVHSFDSDSGETILTGVRVTGFIFRDLCHVKGREGRVTEKEVSSLD